MSLKDLVVTRPSTITYTFWLRFNAKGGRPHISQNAPPMAADERAMQCTVELPRSMFVRPQLTARIEVEDAGRPPVHIDIEAAENALAEVIGATVVMTVHEPEDDTK